MKAYRTPWWYFALGLLFGFVFGAFLVSITESSAISLSGAPWIVLAVMIIGGIVTFVLAWQTHQYATSKPKERKPFKMQMAVSALMLAKSLGMAGAILTGWYAGQIFVCWPHADIPLYSNVIRECVIAGIVCIIDMIIGIVGEWMCQIPPEDGADAAGDSSDRAQQAAAV
ncbi:hypothetical protein gvb03_00470 [Gardnerella vaginalis]|uniref:DUF3180 domain-containing protein n=1 Tax=Gardnerella vaginalis TaxID=2702 RepID=UPI000E21188A|nr:DUF3180 domain-containing protein [Gardnerella vaginalis]RDW96353.1 hypothetical protein gvb02_03590 [Gardnerella vaginalis]RDW98568.1 hypothetical protein gvb03_00470 [Gardnerella vaginalis]